MDSPLTTLVMEDIGWLNVKRIRGDLEYSITEETPALYSVPPLPRRKVDQGDGQDKRGGKWVPEGCMNWLPWLTFTEASLSTISCFANYMRIAGKLPCRCHKDNSSHSPLYS